MAALLIILHLQPREIITISAFKLVGKKNKPKQATRNLKSLYGSADKAGKWDPRRLKIEKLSHEIFGGEKKKKKLKIQFY